MQKYNGSELYTRRTYSSIDPHPCAFDHWRIITSPILNLVSGSEASSHTCFRFQHDWDDHRPSADEREHINLTNMLLQEQTTIVLLYEAPLIWYK